MLLLLLKTKCAVNDLLGCGARVAMAEVEENKRKVKVVIRVGGNRW